VREEEFMAKYQLGSGVVAGKEQVIAYARGTYIDLLTVLRDASLREIVSFEGGKEPASLLAIVQEWSYWQERLPRVLDYWFAQHSSVGGELRWEEIRWLPPLRYPDKLICLGANYSDHNAEMGNTTRSKFPYSFLKPPKTTLIGSGELFTLPEYARMIDWEVELAVVIGKRAHAVRGAEAMSCIAGYSVFNDISVRDWVAPEEQSFMGLDWVMLKGFDKSAPMGPFITPAEFIEDPQHLTLTLSVNGQEKQHANTASMVFSVREIVEHLAMVMTLEPGDVIATGTPSGVGYGRKPREFLRTGDVMVAAIEGLGQLETRVK
jgi:2-keto-4-pentenoate hydratase/2-oxohepta-3-ene-1,7-dioic acid hydratase in catechol pathway